MLFILKVIQSFIYIYLIVSGVLVDVSIKNSKIEPFAAFRPLKHFVVSFLMVNVTKSELDCTKPNYF